jgi:hypothetical protein
MQASSVKNTIAVKSGFSNEQIGLDEDIRWGLVQSAPFADGKDGAPARAQRSTQDNEPHRLREQSHGCLWKDSSQNVVKHHQIVAYELILLALCCTCSLQMYQFHSFIHLFSFCKSLQGQVDP